MQKGRSQSRPFIFMPRPGSQNTSNRKARHSCGRRCHRIRSPLGPSICSTYRIPCPVAPCRACLWPCSALPSAALKTSRYPSLFTANCHQNHHIFVLSSPIAPQIDAVHINIQILTTLQRTVPPILNSDIRILVHLADSGERCIAAHGFPQYPPPNVQRRRQSIYQWRLPPRCSLGGDTTR